MDVLVLFSFSSLQICTAPNAPGANFRSPQPNTSAHLHPCCHTTGRWQNILGWKWGNRLWCILWRSLPFPAQSVFEGKIIVFSCFFISPLQNAINCSVHFLPHGSIFPAVNMLCYLFHGKKKCFLLLSSLLVLPHLSVSFSACFSNKSHFKSNFLRTHVAEGDCRTGCAELSSMLPLFQQGREMDGGSLALQAHLSQFLEEVDRTLPLLVCPFGHRSLREHCFFSSALSCLAPGAWAWRWLGVHIL